MFLFVNVINSICCGWIEGSVYWVTRYEMMDETDASDFSLKRIYSIYRIVEQIQKAVVYIEIE